MTVPRLASHLNLRLLGRAALLFAVVLAMAYGAIHLSRWLETFAAVWPASGVALAVLLTSRVRDWPVYGLAAAGGHFTAVLLYGGAPAIALGFVASRLIEVLLVAGILRRLQRSSDWLASVRSLITLLGTAAVFGPAISATLGTAHIGKAFDVDSWSIWQTWWIGDMVAMLTVAPLLLAWSRRDAHAPAAHPGRAGAPGHRRRLCGDRRPCIRPGRRGR